MELALELVNHVPPGIADRLLERLRATESARCAAEERCTIAEERCATARATVSVVAAAPSHSGLRSCVLIALVSAVVAWGLTLAIIFTPAPPPCPERRQLPTHAGRVPPESSAPQDTLQACSGGENGTEPNTVCEAHLVQVREEAAELRRRRSELETGYNRVLEAISEWTDFLRRVWGPEGLTTASRGKIGLRSSELEAHCLEAARPARNALKDLEVLHRGGAAPVPALEGRRPSASGERRNASVSESPQLGH